MTVQKSAIPRLPALALVPQPSQEKTAGDRDRVVQDPLYLRREGRAYGPTSNLIDVLIADGESSQGTAGVNLAQKLLWCEGQPGNASGLCWPSSRVSSILVSPVSLDL